MASTAVISLALSGAAVVLSVVTTIVSFVQKNREEKRTVRQQLTDIVGKLIETTTKAAEVSFSQQVDGLSVGLLGAYNQNLGALAQQARYLIDRAPTVATSIDYDTIGQAFRDIGDYLTANQLYAKSVETAKGINRAYALRSYAFFLMSTGRSDQARSKFQAALKVPGPDDEFTTSNNGWTHQTWGEAAASAGLFEEATKHFLEARQLYGQLADPLRQRLLDSLTQLESNVAQVGRSRTEESSAQ